MDREVAEIGRTLGLEFNYDRVLDDFLVPNSSFLGEYSVLLSERERCSLGPNSGFEIFVPGRQDG
jgi:hypothetical protein